MRERYVFRNSEFVDRKTGEPMAAPDRIASPMLMKDVTYTSPLSGKEVTSRSQRREEMKVHGVREVEPSEFRPVYRKKKNAIANKGEHDPQAGMRAPDGTEAPFQRLSRDDLPSRIAKTVEKA